MGISGEVESLVSHTRGDWSGLTVAVTGACGGYGAFLVRALLKAGAFVRALDLRRDDHLGLMAEAEASRRLRFVSCDLCAEQPGVLQTALQDVDVVFHTVAYFGDPAFTSNAFANPGHAEKMRKINVTSLQRLLQLCREAGVRAFVHTSSFNVVFSGRREVLLADEETPYVEPAECIDLYSVTKAEGERLVLAADGQGLRTAALRPNGIYGPSLRCYGLLKLLETLAPMRGLYFRFLDRHGKEVEADWCHVENLALAQMLAGKQLLAGNPAVCGSSYGVSDDVISGLPEFVEPIAKGCGWSVLPLVSLPARPLQATAYLVEGAAWALRRGTGWNVKAGLNMVEAAKSTMTNSQSVEKAKRELGFKPIPQAELMRELATFAAAWARGPNVAIPAAPAVLSRAIFVGMAAVLGLSFGNVRRFPAPWRLLQRLLSPLPGVRGASLEKLQRQFRVAVCLPMLGIHAADALLAAHLARSRGHLLWAEYGLRTLVLGMAQLRPLLNSEQVLPRYFAGVAAAFGACAALAARVR